MRQIKAPLNLGQTGDDVVNLQEVLLFFISKNVIVPSNAALVNQLVDESARKLFGAATNAITRDFRDQNGLDAPQPNEPSINETLSQAINQHLSDLQTSTTVLFQGNVKHITGKPLLNIYEVVISAMSYKAVVALGTATTDPDGNYEFIYDFSVGNIPSNNNGYMLKVKTINNEQVLASQEIFRKGAVINLDFIVDDDSLTIDSEFTSIVQSLSSVIGNAAISSIAATNADELAFLSNATGENVPSIKAVVQSFQLQNTLDPNRTNPVTIAPQLFALLRQNVSPNLAVLMSQPKDVLVQALEVSVASNAVALSDNDILSFANSLPSLAVAAFANTISEQSLEESTPYRIASNALNNQSKAQSFITLSAGYNARAAVSQDIWDYIKAQDTNITSSDISNLKAATMLSALTGSNPALTNSLFNSYSQSGLVFDHWAPSLFKEDLRNIIEEQSVASTFLYPDSLTAGDNLNAYTDYVFNAIQKSYPTKSVARSLIYGEENWSALNGLVEHYPTFLSANSTFDLRTDPSYSLEDNSAINLNTIADPVQRRIFIDELGILQRLLNVTDNYRLVASMAQDGLHSAIQIARLSEEQFVQTYAVQAGSEAEAKHIYSAAVSMSAYNYLLAIEQFNQLNTPQVAVLDNTALTNNAYADWRTLFGNLDSCNCSHCQSVYSPAAYLTDLLQFLKANMPELYDNLIVRRPDIVDIELTCKNINTPVPHIDIVNELLEDLVSISRNGLGAYYMFARQTTQDAAIQRVVPEYVNTSSENFHKWDSANKKYEPTATTVDSPYYYLAEAVYPSSLPYNYFKRQIDTHLGVVGVDGYKLLQRFSGKNDLEIWNYEPGSIAGSSVNTDFCAEYIGISKIERDIIIGKKLHPIDPAYPEDPANPFSFYGLKELGMGNLHPVKDPAKRGNNFPAAGAFTKANWWSVIAQRVDVFLQQLSITYGELQEILDCYTINPIDSSQPDTVRRMAIGMGPDATSDATCDLSKLSIVGFNEVTAKKLYRFIRLKRALGWSFYELDKALMSQDAMNNGTGSANITEEMFVKMVQLSQLSKTLRLPISEVALFYKKIDNLPYRNYDSTEVKDVPSEYKRIFRNPLTKDIDDPAYPFKIDFTQNAAPTSGDRTKFLNYLAGVLHINTKELEILFNDLFSATSFTNSLEDLSKIRREVTLVHALQINVKEWLQFRNWMTDPSTFGNGLTAYDKFVNLFNEPFELLRFLTFYETTQKAGVRIEEVGYLLRDTYMDTIAESKDNESIVKMLTSIRSELKNLGFIDYTSNNVVNADLDGRILVGLLAKIMPVEKAEYLTSIILNPVLDPQKVHSADEQRFIELETAFFLSPSEQNQLISRPDNSYQTIVKERKVIAYNGFKQYTQNKILKPYVKSFLSKELKISEEFISVLLNDCIAISGVSQAMDSYIDLAFINSLSPIKRPVLSNDIYAKVFKCTVVLKKAIWLIDKFKLSTSDVLALFGQTTCISTVFKLSDNMVSLNPAVPMVPGAVHTDVQFSKWLSFLHWIDIITFLGKNTEDFYNTLNALTTPIGQPGYVLQNLAAAFKMNVSDLGILLGLGNANTPSSGILDATFTEDYKKPAIYRRIIDCLATQHLLPAPMVALVGVAAAIRNPATQNEANQIIQLVKAQFNDSQWMEVIRPINDTLRTERRDALVAYLVANPPADYSARWYTSNDIYETMMLDVDMMSCMATTRVLLAVNTVQLWVDRVLLGLEFATDINPTTGQYQQLQLSKSNARQWHMWRKLYRVWEANRQVFVYPENWIEPELRDDKSPFFLELEKFLKQNELTESNVQDAYRTYLERLDEVAHLNIIGYYTEEVLDDNQRLQDTIIHIWGRTRSNPHIYFYRNRTAGVWNPWQKMETQIDGSGFAPVKWKGRLRLYWLTFTEIVKEEISTIVVDEEPMHSRKFWKIELNWTELKNGRWSAKQMGKEWLETDPYGPARLKDYRFNYIRRYDWTPNLECYTMSTFNDSFQNLKDSIIPYCLINDKGDLEIIIHGRKKWLSQKTLNDAFEQRYPKREIVRKGIDERGFNQQEVTTFENDNDWSDLLNLQEGLYNSNVRFSEFKGKFVVRSNKIYVSRENVPHTFYDTLIENYAYKPTDSHYIYGNSTVNSYNHLTNVGLADNVVLLTDPQFSTAFDKQKNVLFSRLVPNASSANYISFNNFFYSDYENTFFVETFNYSQKIGLFNMRKTGYRFHNFNDRNVDDFQEILFTKGLDGLLDRATINALADKIDFSNKYKPTSNVPAHVPNGPQDLYPNSKVEFSSIGTYSCYNWELFFHIPMLIANKLMQDQKFEEARKWYHYVFNPTVGEATSANDFWNFSEFYKNAVNVPTVEDVMNDRDGLSTAVARWADNPFKPHLVARTRLSAYMKNTVMKYLDNLIGWGDMLYRTDTRENINEATLMYILAAQMLGRKPVKIPARATTGNYTYNSLNASALNGFNAFSNGLMKLESIMLASGATRLPNNTTTTQNVVNALSGSMYYFCTPPNSKLAGYWDTVADRLFKIRHCQNIDGIERDLALYDPPIDPALLVKAAAAGISLSDALSDINAPLPSYRFNVMVQKATELTQEVKGLGGQLLSALEKKDSEKLALLRSSQEITILDLVTEVKYQQVQDAITQINGLQQQQKSTTQRRDYYKKLVDGGLNSNEQMYLNSLQESIPLKIKQGLAQTLASSLHVVPDFKIGAGTTIGATFGGSSLGSIQSAIASSLGIDATVNDVKGQMASTKGSNIRRREDWEQQLKTTETELKQIDHQILGAQIRKAVAEMELRNHKAQVEHTKTMDEAMRNKYTNEELYEWMVSEISITYFQAHKLATDVAKRAERCYRYELGIETSAFIQPVYWDSLKKGLLAGEQLAYDIKRMEVSFLEKNKRQLELTKHVSLANVFPEALTDLKNSRKNECEIDIPEWLFDMDYPGHHLRRIKSVSISIPCVAGPYTTVSCKLSLLKSRYRKVGTKPANPAYYPEQQLNEDNRFHYQFGNIQSIATSHAQNDSGMFEFSFRDERYLPFEGAGAISTWKIELPAAYSQFDYDSISDVILHINYTALDEGGLKVDAKQNIDTVFQNLVAGSGLYQMFHLNQQFSAEWQAYNNSYARNSEALLSTTISENNFPYYCAGKPITIDRAVAVVKLKEGKALSNQAALKLYFDGGAAQEIIELEINDAGVYTGRVIFQNEFRVCRNKKILKFGLIDDRNKLNMNDWVEDVYFITHYTLNINANVSNPIPDDEDWSDDETTERAKLATPVVTAAQGNGEITLSWPSIPNADSYTIKQGSTILSNEHSLSYVVTGLDNGTSYNFSVIATATGFLSSNAGTKTATPHGGTLATPTLTATPGDGTIQLSWSPVTGETYVIEQCASDTFGAGVTQIYSGSSSPQMIAATNGVKVHFRIKATRVGYTTSNYGYAYATPEEQTIPTSDNQWISLKEDYPEDFAAGTAGIANTSTQSAGFLLPLRHELFPAYTSTRTIQITGADVKWVTKTWSGGMQLAVHLDGQSGQGYDFVNTNVPQFSMSFWNPITFSPNGEASIYVSCNTNLGDPYDSFLEDLQINLKYDVMSQ